MSNAAARYSALEPEKTIYLDRAIECSKYTLPTLITDNDRSTGKNFYTKIQTTYQGLGARGVNNLASKLLIALLPPNQAFFRLSVDDIKLQQELDNYKELQSQFDQQLSLMERTVMRDIEESGDRTALFEALKHLIIGANLGFEKSMKTLWMVFKHGHITKEDLDATLRAHQAAIDATKSTQRDAAEASGLF